MTEHLAASHMTIIGPQCALAVGKEGALSKGHLPGELFAEPGEQAGWISSQAIRRIRHLCPYACKQESQWVVKYLIMNVIRKKEHIFITTGVFYCSEQRKAITTQNY